jgi:hypothetical protein
MAERSEALQQIVERMRREPEKALKLLSNGGGKAIVGVEVQ